MDEYLHVAQKKLPYNAYSIFCWCVIDVFGDQYLRRPNVEDIARVIHMYE